ncbi:site-specific DNA-methyltransferase [Acinetobacter sp. c2-A9]|uniref:site-specific DNA-methyltransferase n=1 Tax=Acinetobacter sp. c2-A9 TaxID=3342802 RepID=UPI0035B7BE94
MTKLKMHSPNLTQDNIARIAEIFPHCVTEATDHNGKVRHAIDFDQLRQELSDTIVEGPQERYHLNWPGKREALLTANAPIAKTLRPCREESVDFDSTQNLFIEGDNLDALKLLQETYLGKVNMIYIDPPYNTGKDFIYEDDFAENTGQYLHRSNQIDEKGNRLTANTASNGRFHSDWLTMMYSRLRLARNLLRDDGAIFISINHKEVANLKRICDEIFGKDNFLSDFIRKTKSTTNDAKTGLNYQHEFLLCYAKNKKSINLLGGSKNLENYTNPDNDPNGAWISDNPSAKSGTPTNNYFSVINPYTGKEDLPPEGRFWLFSKNTLQKHIDEGRICFKKEHRENERGFIYKRFLKDLRTTQSTFDSLAFAKNEFMNQKATKELKELGLVEYFSYPKGVDYIKKILLHSTDKTALVLDFFAGSSTTAHAVMQLNAEDGGNRKFIMVQLPERCDEKGKAYTAGYQTIADISKERIRRAGNKILEGQCHQDWNKDIGFRVFKIDTSNMADVYYSPDALDKTNLDLFVDNIKPDRTPEDLLFQVMLDWGVDLALPITKETMQDKEVFFVDENALAACFDAHGGIDEAFVKELAKRQPLRVVFRDAGFKDSAVKINVEQIFKLLSPATEVKCI